MGIKMHVVLFALLICTPCLGAEPKSTGSMGGQAQSINRSLDSIVEDAESLNDILDRINERLDQINKKLDEIERDLEQVFPPAPSFTPMGVPMEMA